MRNLLQIVSIALLITLSTSYLIRSEEHARKRKEMLEYSGTFGELFIREYSNYTATGIRSETLASMLNMIQIPVEFGREEVEDLPPDAAIMTCLACRSSIGLLLQQYRSGARDREQITSDAIDLCMQLTTYGAVVCNGVVRAYAVSDWFVV
jgi:hypothetical protein